MRGTPRHLNTSADYKYAVHMLPEAYWRPKLHELLTSLNTWQTIGEVAAGDGIEDENHRVIVETRDDGVEVHLQMELTPDPNAKLHRIGLTVEQVNSWLAGA